MILGAMGKRTKFQVKELAQLTLTVNSHKAETNSNLLTTHKCSDLPKVSSKLLKLYCKNNLFNVDKLFNFIITL